MKKVFLSTTLLAICCASLLQAQPSRLDSVITKFQSDNRSFEEFILLGRMACYGNVVGLETIDDKTREHHGWTDLEFMMYAHLYNSITPFTRLFEADSIKKKIDGYFLLNKKDIEKYYSKQPKLDKKDTYDSPRYKQIKLCDSLFDKNDGYKKQYLGFVRNKNNYVIPSKNDSYHREEIKSFQKDYLKHYFIKTLVPEDCCCCD